MKFLALLTMAAAAEAHTIFQKVSVNGVDQGQLKGVRAPSSNNPIENVNHAEFACNANLKFKDSNIITIPAGAKVGAWWGHEIGGASGPNDADNPIAASHKGPIMVYLAKVDNAATAGTTGLKWFKIAENGLNGGTWAVDSMIANQGWHYFSMPSCIAPGNYLMRVEIIALHSASTQGLAQFYMECAQIQVTGSGTTTGSNTVSFPGAYSATHPGIQISIYDAGGKPTNGGRPYSIPGPAVLVCTDGGNGGNSGSTPTTLSTIATPAPTSGSGSVPLYGQCGGSGWTGATACQSGSCKPSNEWYKIPTLVGP
ncbi:glycosyl hydrolase family 61-domain-containing protein [Lasiosphaeria miniovina]|uniref:lytic cellulose monooxygenase (C4-dehydrogenating) n=1 Tax=Lasiosphaeria miniovina TaxID=1954250 RepID=A0AA40BJ98_9PEZI|nr:glycosyl hydrolase family 61-domain-containing protein [Lasiosphaeria miniovina]KAK0735284.1 glycosyl hydrolase family 61-domain-containing protein [Lasiosphaeria miniovina]